MKSSMKPRRAARRGVVGVGDAPRAVGRLERLVVADDRRADGLEQALLVGVGRAQLAPSGQRSRAPRAAARRRSGTRSPSALPTAARPASGRARSRARSPRPAWSAARSPTPAGRAARTAASRAARARAHRATRGTRRVDRVDPRVERRDAGGVARAAEQQPAGADQRAGAQAREPQAALRPHSFHTSICPSATR